MASGSHDPRSREWPEGDGGVHGDGAYGHGVHDGVHDGAHGHGIRDGVHDGVRDSAHEGVRDDAHGDDVRDPGAHRHGDRDDATDQAGRRHLHTPDPYAPDPYTPGHPHAPGPYDSPPTLQHSPPGPSGEDSRGVPLASPWLLPPFSAPTPDDDEPPRARPEGLGGERRRPYGRPYAPAPGPAGPSTSGTPSEPPPATPPAPPPASSQDPPPVPPTPPVSSSGAPDQASGPPGQASGPPDRASGPLDRASGPLDRASGPPAPASAEGGPSGDRPPGPGRHAVPEGGRPRLVNRPDLLVASGPPPERRGRRRAERPDLLVASGPLRERTGREDAARERAAQEDAARERAAQEEAARERAGEDTAPPPAPAPPREGIRVGPVIPATPEPAPEPERPAAAVPEPPPAPERPAASVPVPDRPATAVPGPERHAEPERPAVPVEDDFEPVRRVGRPPGGRPARPDLLVAQGPPGRRGPNGGRHHRPSAAPSAVRRSSPTRRRRGRGLVLPFLMVMVLAVAVGGGLVYWGWVNSPFATGLQLVGDEVGTGDDDFVPQAGVGGNGSNQVLNAVSAVGSVMVAVGSDTTSPVPRPLFLVSSDSGATWRLGKVTGPAGQETGPTTVGRVAGGDGRWLAAGNDPLGSGHGLWTSTDGEEWALVDPAGLADAFSRGDKIMDLARTRSGFVAVGATVLQDGGTGAVAWVSPDGRTWDRVETREIGTPDKVRGIKAVVAAGDTVVALADPAQGQSTSVILRSTDGGRTWQRTGAALDGVVPEPGALAVAGDGFVLVPTQQRDDKGEVRVHCSPEGADWKACGTITGLGPDGSGVKRLASSSAGVAAVVESGFERYTVHTSTDGRDWRRTTDLGTVPGSLRALALSDAGTLVVGGDERAADVDNRVVLITASKGGEPRPVTLDGIEGLTRAARETARVAAGDGRFVAVGSVSGDAGIWSMGTGRQNWTSGGPARLLGGPWRQALADVAYGERGWLAVGGTMTDASSTEPLLVTSSDGESWRRVPLLGPLAPAADHDFLAPHAVAVGASGYVMAGEDRGPAATVPVLWFTPDLKRYTRAAKLPAGGTGVRLHDVSATSSGYVAVGGTGTAERETGVVWVSADGVTWSARKPVLPPGATSAGLRHVVLFGGYVVVGGTARTEDGVRAFGAVSTDNGMNWEFSWLPADRASAVHDLAATPEGVIAVGWQGVPGSGDSVAWISEDGLTWKRHTPGRGGPDGLDGDGAQWLGAVAVSGEQVLALGRSTTYSADHLILWRSTLTSAR
ncbi:hypothetical protein GCM10017559_63070 [Streptosporangium longisporum]|uniref:Exo-alpha-sialidase n=1 Tax=Streptosporangium longisporum TaxID=46187 RepID=A0ABP6L500_9ACTN